MARPLVLRGTLIVLRRRCGKPTCWCARGGVHETPALAYKVAGVTKILTLRPHDIPTVRAALARYQRVLRGLERQVQTSVATLRERIAREKTAGRGRQR
jgi:hypothetical protein